MAVTELLKLSYLPQYPNIFNTSCMVFGSINRDLQLGRPCSIMRSTKLGIDMAKV